MPVSASRQDRFAWLVVLFLFLGSVINYMDRTVLGVVMPRIRRDLSLTNAEYGLAVNAFLVLYMIFYVLGGIVADRLGCRRAFSGLFGRPLSPETRLGSSAAGPHRGNCEVPPRGHPPPPSSPVSARSGRRRAARVSSDWPAAA